MAAGGFYAPLPKRISLEMRANLIADAGVGQMLPPDKRRETRFNEALKHLREVEGAHEHNAEVEGRDIPYEE